MTLDAASTQTVNSRLAHTLPPHFPTVPSLYSVPPLPALTDPSTDRCLREAVQPEEVLGVGIIIDDGRPPGEAVQVGPDHRADRVLHRHQPGERRVGDVLLRRRTPAVLAV